MKKKSSLDTGNIIQPIQHGELHISAANGNWNSHFYTGPMFGIKAGNRVYILYASTENNDQKYRRDVYKEGGVSENASGGTSVSATFYDKTCYYGIYTAQYNQEIDVSGPYVEAEGLSFLDKPAEVAWTLIFGETIYDEIVNIPVQWMRLDGKTLEDTFTIEIGESEEPDPEPEPDPWGGYADVSWGGHHYNFNRRLVPPVQYSNGYCWRQQASEYVAEYTVEQAASMGWLILIR